MLYIDVDGVLADFNKACIQHTGKPYHKECWSILERVPNLFSTLEVMPYSWMVLSFLEQRNIQYELLGALPLLTEKLVTAQRDKVQWVRDKLQIDVQVNLVASRHYKKYFCKCGDILIDDMPDNIKQWEEVGGIGIFHTDWENTIKRLDSILG